MPTFSRILIAVLFCLIYFSTGTKAQPPTPHAQATINASAAKPLVLVIFDEDCQIWCKQVHPVLATLEKEYGARVTFVQLDATGKNLAVSKKKAKELGVLKFFSDALEYVPDVAVFNSRVKLVKDLSGPKKLSQYKAAIETALSQR